MCKLKTHVATMLLFELCLEEHRAQEWVFSNKCGKSSRLEGELLRVASLGVHGKAMFTGLLPNPLVSTLMIPICETCKILWAWSRLIRCFRHKSVTSQEVSWTWTHLHRNRPAFFQPVMFNRSQSHIIKRALYKVAVPVPSQSEWKRARTTWHDAWRTICSQAGWFSTRQCLLSLEVQSS